MAMVSKHTCLLVDDEASRGGRPSRRRDPVPDGLGACPPLLLAEPRGCGCEDGNNVSGAGNYMVDWRQSHTTSRHCC